MDEMPNIQAEDVLRCDVPWSLCTKIMHIHCRVVLNMTHVGVCLCSSLSRIEGMKGVVQRLQQHFMVAFGGATSVPGLEF